MSKKRSKDITKTEEDYYKLKTDAVERLTTADAKSARKRVSDEELKKYKVSKTSKIPVGVKAFFVKFWFAGADCFFFYWGLGTYFNQLDLMVIFTVAMGITTDLLTKNVLKFISGNDKEYYPYLMFSDGKYYTFIANIFYAAIVMGCTVGVYALLGMNVEPVLFGIIYTLIDLFFVGIKNFIRFKIRNR